MEVFLVQSEPQSRPTQVSQNSRGRQSAAGCESTVEVIPLVQSGTVQPLCYIQQSSSLSDFSVLLFLSLSDSIELWSPNWAR